MKAKNKLVFKIKIKAKWEVLKLESFYVFSNKSFPSSCLFNWAFLGSKVIKASSQFKAFCKNLKLQFSKDFHIINFQVKKLNFSSLASSLHLSNLCQFQLVCVSPDEKSIKNRNNSPWHVTRPSIDSFKAGGDNLSIFKVMYEERHLIVISLMHSRVKLFIIGKQCQWIDELTACRKLV